MSEYTPEKVAELVAEARRFDRAKITHDLADALTAVAANRDEFRTAWNAYGFEIIRLEDERDALQAELRQERERAEFYKEGVRVFGDLADTLATYGTKEKP